MRPIADPHDGLRARLRRRARNAAREVANGRHLAASAWLRLTIARSPALPLPAAPRNILVVRLDDIGDWVMTTPFIRELRAHYPFARLTLVCKPGVAGLARRSSRLDEVIVFDPPRRAIPFDQFAALRGAAAFGRSLADRSFDLAILPRRDNDDAAAAMLAYAARVPARLGYPTSVTPLRAVKNRGYDRLLTHVVPSGSARHEVERTLDAVRAVGRVPADTGLDAAPAADDIAAADRLLDDAFADWRDATLIGIAPGAALDRRRWPAASYAAVAAALSGDGSRRFVVIGGPADTLLGRTIAAAGLPARVVDLTGRATLPQTLALLSRCDLFIGNDSGPAHLAAAADIPIVVVSCHPEGGDPEHANAPDRFRPWSGRVHVVRPLSTAGDCGMGCVEASAHCIARVGVPAVVAAATDLLEPVPRASRAAATTSGMHR